MAELTRKFAYPLNTLDTNTLEFSGVGFKFLEYDTMWEDLIQNTQQRIKKEKKLLGLLGDNDQLRDDIDTSLITHHITDIDYNNKSKEILIKGKLLNNHNTTSIIQHINDGGNLSIIPRLFFSKIHEVEGNQYVRIMKIYSFDIDLITQLEEELSH